MFQELFFLPKYVPILHQIPQQDVKLAGLQQSAATSQELTISAGDRRKQDVPVCSEEKLCYIHLYSNPRQKKEKIIW